MKIRLKVVAAILLAAFITHDFAHAQTPTSATPQTPSAEAQNRILGEVTAVDLNAGRLTLKTAQGGQVVLACDGKTVYRRVPPGEQTLENAVAIGLADVGVGDRVIARAGAADAGGTLLARTVIVVSHKDIARKKERDRGEWQSRGVEGVVVEVNPATKEIKLLAQSAEGVRPLTLAAGASNVRRYAPDSVKYSDAVPSSVGEMKAGDRLRAVGERSGDGARFAAEEIVFGTIRTAGGFITAVDAAKGEIKIEDVSTGRPLTIVVRDDSVLRRVPPAIAQKMFAAKSSDSGAGLQKTIETLPPGGIAELKAGDAILASTTAGVTPSRVSAIILLAGVESFLKQHMQQPKGRDFNFTLGLPSGIGQ